VIFVKINRGEHLLLHSLFRSSLTLFATCGSSFVGAGLAMADRFSDGILTTTIVEKLLRCLEGISGEMEDDVGEMEFRLLRG
jgi:hypothetical protein